MKSKSLFVISALAAAVSSYAAETGGSTKTTTAPTPPAPPPVTAVPGTGPQVTGLFRFVKPDGLNVIAQGAIATNTSAITTITMAASNAISSGSGRCAFNVKYDEISSVVAVNTTNRLYSNDTLIAQNTMLNLDANALKTVWTQPYLYAGLNNVRIVINADGAKPSTGWVRVNVTGNCGGVTAPAPAPAPVPPKTTEPPRTTTPPPVVEVKYVPGSAQWNQLYTAFGYSNYGVTQLKGKGYARYDELLKLNAAITQVVNAKTVTQGVFNELMARWNSFLNDPKFVAAMKSAVPGVDGKK